jgi:hypothetical protein
MSFAKVRTRLRRPCASAKPLTLEALPPPTWQDHRPRGEYGALAREAQAEAEVDVLEEGEVALVEAAGAFEGVAAIEGGGGAGGEDLGLCRS